MKKKKMGAALNINLVPMIDVTSFILLALGILVMSMKKEASLDSVLRLPPVSHAAKQDTAQLQIYILQASLQPGGLINPDSTGLVAFMAKTAVPAKCPNCSTAFRDERGTYIPNTLLDLTGKRALASIQSSNTATDKPAASQRPPAYKCGKCRTEISQYLRLDEIPILLKQEKMKVVEKFLEAEKQGYFKLNGAIMPPDKVKLMEDSLKRNIPLMIKADNEAFYGRILQVVNMAKDTLCDIRRFAFISDPATAELFQKEARKKSGK